jgi:hypothetical protein
MMRVINLFFLQKYSFGHQPSVDEVDGARGTGGRGNMDLFWGKSRGKRPLRRLKRGLENDSSADSEGTECEGVDWIKLVQY